MSKRRVTYMAKVLGNTLSISKEKETPSVKIKFLTLYDTNDPNTVVSEKIYGNLWLSYKAAERSLSTLKDVFGWKGAQVKELNDPVLVGKVCEIVVDWDDDFDGKERPNIQFYNLPGGLKSLVESDLEKVVGDVQETFNKILGIKNPVPILTNNESQVTSPPPVIEDDLPF